MGALRNSFSARFAIRTVQAMKELLEGYEFAASYLDTTLADSGKLGLSGLY
jgi:hypothetical protein